MEHRFPMYSEIDRLRRSSTSNFYNAKLGRLTTTDRGPNVQIPFTTFTVSLQPLSNLVTYKVHHNPYKYQITVAHQFVISSFSVFAWTNRYVNNRLTDTRTDAGKSNVCFAQVINACVRRLSFIQLRCLFSIRSHAFVIGLIARSLLQQSTNANLFLHVK